MDKILNERAEKEVSKSYNRRVTVAVVLCAAGPFMRAVVVFFLLTLW